MTQAAQSLSELLRLSSNLNGLLDANEAAQYLNIAPGSLAVWRSTGRYSIPFVKVGRSVKYRLNDLNAWIESRTQTNGTTA